MTKQRTQPIRADRYWNPTGIHVAEGSQYRAHVVPEGGEALRDASHHARSIAGEDWQTLPHKTATLFHGKRMDDALWFALIGTVERRQPWVVVDGGLFTAPASGELVCYFNDVEVELFYANNKGRVVLDIESVTGTA